MRRGADLDDALFGQRCGRAGLHAGPARYAIRCHERLMHPRRHPAVKPTPLDGQRECALHLFTGADAARTDDAFRRIIGEIGVAVVLWHELPVLHTRGVFGPEMGLHRLVPHIAQANRPRHVLQFTIAIGGTGQAIQRVVADIKLHHPAPQLLQPAGLGVNHHSGCDRCGAGRWRAIAPLDLHQTQAARAERIDRVGGAQFRDADPRLVRRPHDRSARRNRDGKAIHRQGHHLL